MFEFMATSHTTITSTSQSQLYQADLTENNTFYHLCYNIPHKTWYISEHLKRTLNIDKNI